MDRLVDLLVVAGVLAMVALPVAVLVIGVLVSINRRRSHAVKVWMARHGDLKRRLADVEALRKRDPVPGVYREDQGRCDVPPAGWDCTRAPGHDGPCAAVPSMIREHLGDIVEPGEPIRPIYARPVHGGYPG